MMATQMIVADEQLIVLIVCFFFLQVEFDSEKKIHRRPSLFQTPIRRRPHYSHLLGYIWDDILFAHKQRNLLVYFIFPVWRCKAITTLSLLRLMNEICQDQDAEFRDRFHPFCFPELFSR